MSRVFVPRVHVDIKFGRVTNRPPKHVEVKLYDQDAEAPEAEEGKP